MRFIAGRCKRRVDAEDGVGFFVGEAVVGADAERTEFLVDVFGESADFVVEGAVGELEVVVVDEFGEVIDAEGDVDGDGDGADGEEFDGAFDAEWAVGSDALGGREADHLRAVEEELSGAAFGGIDFKLGHGLSEEFPDGLAGHLVGDVEGIDVDDLAGVMVDGGRGRGRGSVWGGLGHMTGGILICGGREAQSEWRNRNAYLMCLLRELMRAGEGCALLDWGLENDAGGGMVAG